MDDLISRQAAIDAIANCTNCGTPDELRKYVDKHSLENGWTGGVLDAMEAVEDIPAADVVPVVRCEDCKYHSFDAEYGNYWCNLTSGSRKIERFDFCSYGERKKA